MSGTTQHPLPRLLKATDVAEQTGLSRARVYELTRNGVLPHVRFGRAVRYPAPRLREWIAAGGTANNGDEGR